MLLLIVVSVASRLLDEIIYIFLPHTLLQELCRPLFSRRDPHAIKQVEREPSEE